MSEKIFCTFPVIMAPNQTLTLSTEIPFVVENFEKVRFGQEFTS